MRNIITIIVEKPSVNKKLTIAKMLLNLKKYTVYDIILLKLG